VSACIAQAVDIYKLLLAFCIFPDVNVPYLTHRTYLTLGFMGSVTLLFSNAFIFLE